MGTWFGVAVLVAGAVSACGPDGGRAATDPGTASTPVTAAPTPDAAWPTAAPSPTVPTPLTEPTPGQPCEPGSHPDCSNQTGNPGDPFRIIAGYADCVASFGQDEADGLCTDLDGDDHAGYADAG